MGEIVEVFIVYVSFLSLRLKITIYLARKAQIAILRAEKVPFLAKYADFDNLFLMELARVLPKQTGINKPTIQLHKGKQPLYKAIYSLSPMKLKFFKTYIKTNLTISFI